MISYEYIHELAQKFLSCLCWFLVKFFSFCEVHTPVDAQKEKRKTDDTLFQVAYTPNQVVFT